MQTSSEVIPQQQGASSHNLNAWRRIGEYQHHGLCARFAEKYGMSLDQANAVFMEMKRFLYVAMVSQEPCSPSKVVDDMWHEFICHTVHYRFFCNDFNGEFIDHTPSDKPELEGYTRTKAFAEQLFGPLDEFAWPEPSLANAGSCSCTNKGCACNCKSNLGVDAKLTLGREAMQ